MEIFNSVAKQQNTQIQTEQKVVQPKTTPTQELKTKVEKTQEKDDNKNQPIKSEVELKDLINKLNRALDPFNTSIRFGFDNDEDTFYVSVIDTQTSTTIRRFPAKEAQGLASKMNEIVGIIFDEKG